MKFSELKVGDEFSIVRGCISSGHYIKVDNIKNQSSGRVALDGSQRGSFFPTHENRQVTKRG